MSSKEEIDAADDLAARALQEIDAMADRAMETLSQRAERSRRRYRLIVAIAIAYFSLAAALFVVAIVALAR